MSDLSSLAQKASDLSSKSKEIMEGSKQLALQLQAAAQEATHAGHDPLVMGLTIFMLACFVGYYVVWRVTPALHSPLMAVTNAISSVIIVGALLAAGAVSGFSTTFGLIAIFLASINIFGGFVVTQRMLAMFSKKKNKD
ncbi:MAG: hypothetical protein NEHIOOID_00440 [Holosporales bacterium]